MTTILSVRRGGKVAIGGDGQASLGDTIMKSTALKIRTLTREGSKYPIFAGFAGSTADALTLFERLELKLQKYSFDLQRSSVELAKDWRSDRFLRRLEAIMLVVDYKDTFAISGVGDVFVPDSGIFAIGSGGNYALAAARAFIENKKLDVEDIVKKSLTIAADICVYSNHNIIVKSIKHESADC